MAALEELPLEFPAPAPGVEPVAQAIAVDAEIPFVLLGFTKDLDVFRHAATVRRIIGRSIGNATRRGRQCIGAPKTAPAKALTPL